MSFIRAAFAAILFLAAGSARAEADFVPLGAYSAPPIGWAVFCRDNPGECDRGSGTGQIIFSRANLDTIIRINDLANKSVNPMEDRAQWGVDEKWSYPDTGYGDCEDYVLLKRKLLMEAGFPRSALLIAIVKQKNGDGHAVLVVRTTGGDLVLDSLEPDVKLWRKAPYAFYRVQSPVSPYAWHDIGAGVVGSTRR
jgi:predicted transglutaminase-like cysteine proteinase